MEGTPMISRGTPLTIAIIYDAELNAYEAALSEGWPVNRERVKAHIHSPTVEPFSQFLKRTPRWTALLQRVAA
jgi:hypothetical protein